MTVVTMTQWRPTHSCVAGRSLIGTYVVHMLTSMDSNIQRCGAVLQHILSHLGNQTGLKFTVLMGGIDPLDPEDGKFIARSAHSCILDQ